MKLMMFAVGACFVVRWLVALVLMLPLVRLRGIAAPRSSGPASLHVSGRRSAARGAGGNRGTVGAVWIVDSTGVGRLP